jgi:hypothetical protein
LADHSPPRQVDLQRRAEEVVHRRRLIRRRRLSYGSGGRQGDDSRAGSDPQHEQSSLGRRLDDAEIAASLSPAAEPE